MYAAIHKKHFKTSAALLVGLACLLLFLSIGQDLFHNHEADSDTHHECPAYQIFLMLSAAIVVDCMCRFFFLVVLFFKRIFRPSDDSIFRLSHHSRAPPFRVLKAD